MSSRKNMAAESITLELNSKSFSYLVNRLGNPQVVLSDDEAESLALALLTTVEISRSTGKFIKKKTLKPTFNVVVIGHDRWRGAETLYVKAYKTKVGALNFCEKINGKNTAKVVPDYYETAEIQY